MSFADVERKMCSIIKYRKERSTFIYLLVLYEMRSHTNRKYIRFATIKIDEAIRLHQITCQIKYSYWFNAIAGKTTIVSMEISQGFMDYALLIFFL